MYAADSTDSLFFYAVRTFPDSYQELMYGFELPIVAIARIVSRSCCVSDTHVAPTSQT